MRRKIVSTVDTIATLQYNCIFVDHLLLERVEFFANKYTLQILEMWIDNLEGAGKYRLCCFVRLHDAQCLVALSNFGGPLGQPGDVLRQARQINSDLRD